MSRIVAEPTPLGQGASDQGATNAGKSLEGCLRGSAVTVVTIASVLSVVAVGRQIRKIREEKGYSQENFAALAGLGRAHYGGIERGVHNISALNLMRIASALKVEVGELFPTRDVFDPLLESSRADG